MCARDEGLAMAQQDQPIFCRFPTATCVPAESAGVVGSKIVCPSWPVVHAWKIESDVPLPVPMLALRPLPWRCTAAATDVEEATSSLVHELD